MSASLRNGGRVLLHLPFFDKYARQPSFLRSFPLPLWFLLCLSLNVRREEAAGIIGHASVGLFDHVTRLRLHTYVPLNKPSNVAPEAEHGSKGSRGAGGGGEPALCNDGKMEHFCLGLCVCVCLRVCEMCISSIALLRATPGITFLCCLCIKSHRHPKHSL